MFPIILMAWLSSDPHKQIFVLILRHSNQNLISHSRPDDVSGASVVVAIGAGNSKFDSVKEFTVHFHHSFSWQ